MQEKATDVTLRPLTTDNWEQCIRLKVAPEQAHFVASNTYSLAQAAYEDDCVPLAVYADEVMVGFVMYWHLPPEPTYHISRLMIGAAYQQRGYGRLAMQQLLTRLTAYADCQAIDISYDPPNEVARQLYASLGFRETGEIDDGEVVARLAVVR